ncbi:MAG TPA: hypothetical protein PKA88_38470 [Polyangiaceae bacterium]|nr:hypothetical protein [Polyangiaceae bacterium]HMR78255.1 hypothetical protein [Polyangiaceae bacterium]
MRRILTLTVALTMITMAPACGTDDSSGNSGGSSGTGASGGSGGASGGGGSSGTGAAAGTSGSGGGAGTLCAKYGGAANIKTVIETHVIGEIAADCRINTFFTTLPKEGLQRVSDCLSIQAQELFQCPGITYAGSKASNGIPCRDMSSAHAGLNISSGDFDALIEDVVAGLKKANVADEDIAAAAPALLGLKGDIVEKPAETNPTKGVCADGGPADAGAD